MEEQSNVYCGLSHSTQLTVPHSALPDYWLGSGYVKEWTEIPANSRDVWDRKSDIVATDPQLLLDIRILKAATLNRDNWWSMLDQAKSQLTGT